jgi:hypothetical protein
MPTATADLLAAGPTQAKRHFVLDEKRRTPRQRTLKGGVIAFNGRFSKVDCIVANLTPEGALLKLDSTDSIPDRIELRLVDEEYRVCRVIWRRRDRLGVAFE